MASLALLLVLLAAPAGSQPRSGGDGAPLTAMVARCDGGDLKGCADLAVGYEFGHYGLARDPAKAADLNHRACDANIASACVRLASAYYRGTGLLQDRARSALLNEKACGLGYAEGCAILAWQYARGDGAPRDPARAATAWQKGCDLGDLELCRGFAIALESGEYIPQDRTRALALFLSTCERKHFSACASAALLVRAGVKPGNSVGHAASVLQAACEHGYETQDVCLELGTMYRVGEGVPQDRDHSLQLFNIGCGHGYIPACRAADTLVGDTAQTDTNERLSAKGYLSTARVRIHARLPPMRLRFFGDDYGRVSAIEVFDADRQRVIQRLACPAREELQAPYRGQPPFHLSDLNFDGYQDLLLLSWWGATGNKGYLVWIFDPSRRQFAYHRGLSGLSNLEADAKARVLTTFSTGGAAGMICGAERYRWLGGASARRAADHPRLGFKE